MLGAMSAVAAAALATAPPPASGADYSACMPQDSVDAVLI